LLEQFVWQPLALLGKTNIKRNQNNGAGGSGSLRRQNYSV
jgi:hypothetical protein